MSHDKKQKRRKIIIFTVSVYALTAIVLFVFNIITVHSSASIDAMVWKASFELGESFPSGGFFNDRQIATLVLSNFKSLTFPPRATLSGSTLLSQNKPAPDIASKPLQILGTPYGRCSITNAVLASEHFESGTRLSIARDREDRTILALSLNSPKSPPSGQILINNTAVVTCNSVEIQGMPANDSDVSFQFAPQDDHIATFTGGRPLNIAMQWNGPIPELHEQNVSIRSLDLMDRKSPSHSNTSLISGKLSLIDVDKEISLGPADHLELEKISRFNIEDLALDPRTGGLHLVANGVAGQIRRNDSDETVTLLQWLDSQHKWTRWYALVGIVALTVINIVQFFRE